MFVVKYTDVPNGQFVGSARLAPRRPLKISIITRDLDQRDWASRIQASGKTFRLSSGS